MDVGGVDDPVRCGGATAQAVEVVEGAAKGGRAGGGDRRLTGVRARQAGDLVAGVEQIADNGRADEARCSGKEYTHENAPF